MSICTFIMAVQNAKQAFSNGRPPCLRDVDRRRNILKMHGFTNGPATARLGRVLADDALKPVRTGPRSRPFSANVAPIVNGGYRSNAEMTQGPSDKTRA